AGLCRRHECQGGRELVLQVVWHLKDCVPKILDFVALLDPFLPGGGPKQGDPKTKRMGRTHTNFLLLLSFQFEEQHVCYRISYSLERLQGSVLPVKHTPGNPFSTEHLAQIVRQSRR